MTRSLLCAVPATTKATVAAAAAHSNVVKFQRSSLSFLLGFFFFLLQAYCAQSTKKAEAIKKETKTGLSLMYER